MSTVFEVETVEFALTPLSNCRPLFWEKKNRNTCTLYHNNLGGRMIKKDHRH